MVSGAVRCQLEAEADQQRAAEPARVRSWNRDALVSRFLTSVANSTVTMSAEVKAQLTMVPRIRNCAQIGRPASGLTNCGRKAMKKIATFGLSTSTRMLSRNARRVDFCGRFGIGPAGNACADHLHAQKDQVGAADQLEREIERRHHGEQGRQAEGRRQHMDITAEMNTGRRHEPGAPAARDGLRRGVEQRGARHVGKEPLRRERRETSLWSSQARVRIR